MTGAGRTEGAVPVFPGERWRRLDEEAYWTVVSVNPALKLVGMSGPGPCRAYRSVSLAMFLREWERVEQWR